MHRKLQHLREEYNIKKAKAKIAAIEKENKRSEILETLKNTWVTLLKDPTYTGPSKKFYVPLQWTVNYGCLEDVFPSSTKIKKKQIQFSCIGDCGEYNSADTIGDDNARYLGWEFLGYSMMHWVFGVGRVGVEHAKRLKDEFFEVTSCNNIEGHYMQGKMTVVLVTL